MGEAEVDRTLTVNSGFVLPHPHPIPAPPPAVIAPSECPPSLRHRRHPERAQPSPPPSSHARTPYACHPDRSLLMRPVILSAASRRLIAGGEVERPRRPPPNPNRPPRSPNNLQPLLLLCTMRTSLASSQLRNRASLVLSCQPTACKLSAQEPASLALDDLPMRSSPANPPVTRTPPHAPPATATLHRDRTAG